MFRLNLEPVNPDVVKSWLIRCGITAGGAGMISVSTLVDRIRELFPQAVLIQLPNYEQFLYMAVGIAFITGLPLLIFPKVLTLSFAQMGFAASLLYLGYSLLGVFIRGFEIVPRILLVLMALIFAVLFSDGLRFAYRDKSWSDFWKDLAILLLFIVIWMLPIWVIWRQS
jgi:hypothetical protein